MKMEANICTKLISRWLIVLFLLLVLALVAIFAIRYYETKPASQTGFEVVVHEGMPASLAKLVLHLKVSELHGSERRASEQSLLSPESGSSGSFGTNQFYDLTRLVDISTNGFEIFFLKRYNNVIEGTNILFAFGKTTETNILDWNVVGTFK
jgi:hypothetical protein